MCVIGLDWNVLWQYVLRLRDPCTNLYDPYAEYLSKKKKKRGSRNKKYWAKWRQSVQFEKDTTKFLETWRLWWLENTHHILFCFLSLSLPVLFYQFLETDLGGGGGDDAESAKEKEEEAERERLEAIKEAEERRKDKHRKMEEEREKMRQDIRDKVSHQPTHI